ncbi:hypothetical protein OUZ56_017546 [Daphnia magna]|uniref:Uncharacterized protein n=1 Tax=Daphnia magna TaxID=35525 RepID=A0ABR0AT68_9CRUS|nr:hypothetical protein OUZ56_017546 [Daphnia magna]
MVLHESWPTFKRNNNECARRKPSHQKLKGCVGRIIKEAKNEEFDHQAKLFLKRDKVYRHNDLLLVIVTKCHSLCQPSPKVKSCKIKPITVTRQAQPKNKPLGVNFHIPRAIEKPQVRHCSQDLTVFDAGLVHGRMLVVAWDVGLDHGCEDKAIKLILSYIRLVSRRLILDFSTNNSYGTQISRMAEPTHVSAVPPDNSECRTRVDVLA